MMQVTKEVFEAANGRLKVVGRAGVGVDNVDLAAATEVAFLLLSAVSVCSHTDDLIQCTKAAASHDDIDDNVDMDI